MKINEKVFKYSVDKKVTNDDNLIVSVCFLYKKADGDYTLLLQRMLIVETDENSIPQLVLSFVQDVSHLKRKDTCDALIRLRNEYLFFRLNQENDLLEEIPPISKQEIKVLKLLKKGMNTNEIAKELFSSINTINTHRRNLIIKTNCVDTTAVITYVMLVGLL